MSLADSVWCGPEGYYVQMSAIALDLPAQSSFKSDGGRNGLCYSIPVLLLHSFVVDY